MNNNYSLYYNGYAVMTSPFTVALDVYLAPFPTDAKNKVDIWIKSFPFHGKPLIQVSQSEGSFSISSVMQDSIPLEGYTRLDAYSNTLTRVYRNPNNDYPSY